MRRILASTAAGKPPTLLEPCREGVGLLTSTRNRNPPDGYRLSRIEFSDGQPVAAADSRDAEVPVMWNPNNGACPNGCFRPCGLAVDGDDRVFMSSDTTGEIFVIVEG